MSLILSVRYSVRIKEIMKHFICIFGCNAPVIVRDYAVEMIIEMHRVKSLKSVIRRNKYATRRDISCQWNRYVQNNVLDMAEQ